MDLPDPGIKPGSPALQAGYLPTELSRKLHQDETSSWHTKSVGRGRERKKEAGRGQEGEKEASTRTVDLPKGQRPQKSVPRLPYPLLCFPSWKIIPVVPLLVFHMTKPHGSQLIMLGPAWLPLSSSGACRALQGADPGTPPTPSHLPPPSHPHQGGVPPETWLSVGPARGLRTSQHGRALPTPGLLGVHRPDG